MSVIIINKVLRLPGKEISELLNRLAVYGKQRKKTGDDNFPVIPLWQGVYQLMTTRICCHTRINSLLQSAKKRLGSTFAFTPLKT